MTDPIAPFKSRLLGWYDTHKRDLPWRRTGDPWAIWVSEVMLQQTRVEAVREAYGRFLDRFPTPGSFAAASDEDLQAAWRGLGYYRRARLLREAARRVTAEHGGTVPDDPETLGRMPGVGPYTRGALVSIAFGAPELAVDGNVERVVARHRSIREPIKGRDASRRIRDVVAGWQDPARPGDFNQALMELGATVCLPNTAPVCDRCPVAGDCLGLRAGIAADLPLRPVPRTPVTVAARAAWIPRNGAVLARRIPDGEVNGGQVELPGPGLLHDLDGPPALAAALRRAFDAEVEVGPPLATIRHAITFHRITLTVHGAELRRAGALFPAEPQDPAVPWSTASRKVFRALGRSGP